MEEKPARYSRALLETLALIAYRQPITRGEIEDIRGVVVSTHIIKALDEHEWIRVVGHKDVPGKPALYATTKAFLDHFNLKSLDELPPLAELKDFDSIMQQGEQQELALEAQMSPEGSFLEGLVTETENNPEEVLDEDAITSEEEAVEGSADVTVTAETDLAETAEEASLEEFAAVEEFNLDIEAERETSDLEKLDLADLEEEESLPDDWEALVDSIVNESEAFDDAE
jgi:segregation and condensation protein B